MSLVGTPLLLLAAAATAACPVAVVLLWHRVRGPRPVRAAGRLAMLLAAQAVALVFALIAVNDYGGFYETWSDLAGALGIGPVEVTRSHVPESAQP